MNNMGFTQQFRKKLIRAFNYLQNRKRVCRSAYPLLLCIPLYHL